MSYDEWDEYNYEIWKVKRFGNDKDVAALTKRLFQKYNKNDDCLDCDAIGNEPCALTCPNREK
jgi:hypothetical protein